MLNRLSIHPFKHVNVFLVKKEKLITIFSLHCLNYKYSKPLGTYKS